MTCSSNLYFSHGGIGVVVAFFLASVFVLFSVCFRVSAPSQERDLSTVYLHYR